MTAPFHFGSPREERRIAELRRNMQAAVAAAGEEVLAEDKARALIRVDRFRSDLPPHRKGWFDSLSYVDQRRLAAFMPAERYDTQRDYDDEREHGWSV
jgi:hypothetical protein